MTPEQPLTPVERSPGPSGDPASQRLAFRTEVPQPSLEYRTAFGKWLSRGESVDGHGIHEVTTHPWWKVIWLTGVDYFSTLGYQPGIALLAAGAVAPIATVILILVTLLGALPVYAQVAGRSYAGQGSIAMLENLLSGWKGKGLVLVLLGFAATDFVITMTLSAADAAKHAVENPFLHPVLGDHQILVTLAILTVLAAVFLKGFGEAIGLAAAAGALPAAAVDGDFIMTAAEVQPVLRALRKAGIHVVALHNHMTGEQPAFYFTHFWGKGKAGELARGLRSALDAQTKAGKDH